MAAARDTSWPDSLIATDLQLVPVRPGVVYGSYRYRVTQHGTTTYSYTTNGELHSKVTGGQTTTYAYDVLGNLTSVTLPDGTLLAYVIDGKKFGGLRVLPFPAFQAGECGIFVGRVCHNHERHLRHHQGGELRAGGAVPPLQERGPSHQK